MEQWWKRAGVIFAGGAVGTACRALLLHALDQQTVALAVVNLTGCLLIGVVSGWWGARTSLLRLFLADSTNEARVIDTVDTTVRRAADLGFLRPLRGQPDHWEVRRILKAYVDAQTMSDFTAKLTEYAQSGSHGSRASGTGATGSRGVGAGNE